MKKERFEELRSSVREAVEIQKGRRNAAAVYEYEEVDVQAVRAGMGLSQSEFAMLLGISRRTLENWEQGHRSPQGPARRLLQVAARFPDAVYRTVFDTRTTGRRSKAA